MTAYVHVTISGFHMVNTALLKRPAEQMARSERERDASNALWWFVSDLTAHMNNNAALAALPLLIHCGRWGGEH